MTFTQYCPHCQAELDLKRAMASSRAKPVRCKRCDLESWFKAPNGLAFLVVFLIVAPAVVAEYLGLSSWAFVGVVLASAAVAIAGDRYLSLRYGRMVGKPVIKVGG